MRKGMSQKKFFRICLAVEDTFYLEKKKRECLKTIFYNQLACNAFLYSRRHRSRAISCSTMGRG